jgi:hypothetical protein
LSVVSPHQVLVAAYKVLAGGFKIQKISVWFPSSQSSHKNNMDAITIATTAASHTALRQVFLSFNPAI